MTRWRKARREELARQQADDAELVAAINEARRASGLAETTAEDLRAMLDAATMILDRAERSPGEASP